MRDDTDDRDRTAKPMLSVARAVAGEGTSLLRKILGGFAAGLGIGGGKPPIPSESGGQTDVGTRLAGERTDLALERTYWAAERTLMGWIRTGLSMISFGFTIGKIGQTLRDVDVQGFRGPHVIGVDSIARALVIIGTVSLLAAAVQYAIRVYERSEQGLRVQLSIAFVVALMLFLLGAFALSALVLNL